MNAAAWGTVIGLGALAAMVALITAVIVVVLLRSDERHEHGPAPVRHRRRWRWPWSRKLASTPVASGETVTFHAEKIGVTRVLTTSDLQLGPPDLVDQTVVGMRWELEKGAEARDRHLDLTTLTVTDEPWYYGEGAWRTEGRKLTVEALAWPKEVPVPLPAGKLSFEGWRTL